MFHNNREFIGNLLVGGCISIFMVLGISFLKPAVSKFISPLASSHMGSNPVGEAKGIHRVFSFAPGWALRKMEHIEFQGLDTLAFFDLPVLHDGTLLRENDAYVLLRDHSAELLDRAHAHGSKVVLTITQADNQTIKDIIRDRNLQQVLIDELLVEMHETGIDGVNIDFDLRNDDGKEYRGHFNAFVRNVSTQIHSNFRDSQVSISLSNSALHDSMYDISYLAEVTDKVFVMAYNIAVPESPTTASVVSSPTYAHNERDYWGQLSQYLDGFIQYVPKDKLVIERAWYGNGDNYPLPSMADLQRASMENEDLEYNTLQTPLAQDVIERMVESVPSDREHAVRKNIPLIADALKRENILNPNVLAYALATIEHETAGTFEPIEEILGRKSARRLGYEGGTNYFGRGFIQLTHLRNYKVIGQRIGLGDKLAENPDLALRADISAKILAAYFKDNGIATLATNGDFISARTPINPDYQGWWIANLAWKYLEALG